MTQTQFDALTAYIDAAINLAVARAECICPGSESLSHRNESRALVKAEKAAQAALVDETP